MYVFYVDICKIYKILITSMHIGLKNFIIFVLINNNHSVCMCYTRRLEKITKVGSFMYRNPSCVVNDF